MVLGHLASIKVMCILVIVLGMLSVHIDYRYYGFGLRSEGHAAVCSLKAAGADEWILLDSGSMVNAC